MRSESAEVIILLPKDHPWLHLFLGKEEMIAEIYKVANVRIGYKK